MGLIVQKVHYWRLRGGSTRAAISPAVLGPKPVKAHERDC